MANTTQDEYRIKCIELIQSEIYCDTEIDLDTTNIKSIQSVLGDHTQLFINTVQILNEWVFWENAEEYPNFEELPFEIVVAIAHILVFEDKISDLDEYISEHKGWNTINYEDWGTLDSKFTEMHSAIEDTMEECINYFRFGERSNERDTTFMKRYGSNFGIYQIRINGLEATDTYWDVATKCLSYNNVYNFNIDSDNSIYCLDELTDFY